MVSIWCITYNHERYIQDAIEGFLNQKTNFKYEIIIHDDASTDDTANIIKEYEMKYPTIIHGIYQSQNQWSENRLDLNWMMKILRQNCKGKYIAMCEGDDYWIDLNKLQIQIDYMERNAECVMSVHNAVDINYKSGSVKARSLFESERDLTAEQVILPSCGLPTASMVLKKEISEINDFFLEAGIGDYPLELYSLSKGTIHYFDRIMSVYRFRHKGSYEESLYLDKKTCFIHFIGLISFLEQYNRYTYRKYERYVIERVHVYVNGIIQSYAGETRERFMKDCRECDGITKNKFHAYIEEVIRIYLLVFDEDFFEGEIQKYCEESKKVYIMGAGKYAAVIAKKLDKYHIDYQGFVVSDNQKCAGLYLGKEVWKFNELTSELENAALVVGINPCIWSQIDRQLEEAKINSYCCPFCVSTDEFN